MHQVMEKTVLALLETFAEPSLQATQMKLKRARLADDLNEKIAQRPGPMELVEKNILPVDSSVKEAIIGKTRCAVCWGSAWMMQIKQFSKGPSQSVLSVH